MTRSVADDARTGRLFSRFAELDRRMQAEGLEEDWVLNGLQALIEGRGWRGMSDADSGVDTDILGSPARWKLDIIHAASRQLKKFGSGWAKQARQTPLPVEWTPEFLANAALYNLRPVFFPEADINEAFQKKGFTKLNDFFYAHVRNGGIQGDNPTKLQKGWCLADFSVGVDYTDGSQVFPDDPWAELLTDLRTQKLIGKRKNTPLGSRFAITWDEWNDCLLAQMASKLSATRAQTTLECALEHNFVGNVYDPNRGCFNMWQWFQDQFGDSIRLIGGHRDYGGLADASCRWRGPSCDDVVSRPLLRFDE